MSKKLTYEFVKKSFEKEGYALLSKEYKNNYTKLFYICSEGHEHSITWSDWKNGYRCAYCAGLGKPSIDIVKASFALEDYTLLSKSYINSKTKLECLCSEGHNYSVRWNDWQKGIRCVKCAGNKKLTIKDMQIAFKKEDYTLISKTYVNAFTKLEYVCDEGHINSIRWNDWQQGNRCPTCGYINSLAGCKSGGLYCEEWQDQEYKQDIRDRDGNKCLNPYCCSPDKNDLTIHHIDYDKKNCKPSNLITVCRSCNSKANKDREWHQAWYQALIYNKYFNKGINYE